MKPLNDKVCDAIQFRLADRGLHVLTDDAEMQAHIGECQECFDFLGALETVDRELEAAPEHAPSDELVAATLRKIAQLPATQPERAAEGKMTKLVGSGWAQGLSGVLQTLRWIRIVALRPRIAGAAAAACVLLLGLRVAFNDGSRSDKAERRFKQEQFSRSEYGEATLGGGNADGASPNFSDRDEMRTQPPAPHPLRQRQADESQGKAKSAEQYNDLREAKVQGDTLEKRLKESERKNEAYKDRVNGVFESLANRVEGVGREIDTLAQAKKSMLEPAPEAAAPASAGPEEAESDQIRIQEDAPATIRGLVRKSKDKRDFASGVHFERAQRGDSPSSPINAPAPSINLKSGAKRNIAEQASADSMNLLADREAAADGKIAEPKEQSTNSKSLKKDSISDKTERKAYLDNALTTRGVSNVAVGFLDKTLGAGLVAAEKSNRRAMSEALEAQTLPSEPHETSFRSLNNLLFKDPSGYWFNTYVPGDPAIRVLRSTLQKELGNGDRSNELGLHGLSEYPQQPFDVPANAALGLQLSADRTGLVGPGRLLVQVGLQGTERNAGRRPALNVAIVLDLSSAPSEAMQTQIRDLISVFSESKDVGDQYRLFVGNTGAAISSEEFRHGPLSLALNAAFASSPDSEANLGGLRNAYGKSLESVRSSDDPNAPLGSSSVIVVSDRTSSGPAQLSEAARVSAVDGIQTSVILLNQNSNAGLEEWESVAVQGQGSRHVLTPGEDAKVVVAKEVANVSRTVARAVRLRIRLAPGVKLVNVLGSYRLDENRAQQVRDAEKSVDRRIARTMGIEADRGEDEEGIQIVIPAFYAGDSHVVLLDVVAPGAGAIADVRIRYKDLVHLKNAVATANLSTGRSVSALGPLEQNVLKNFLVQNLSEALIAGSNCGLRGEPLPDLERYVALYQEVLTLAPGLERDSEVLADQRMLARYNEIRNIFLSMDEATRKIIAESIQIAGVQKTLPIDTKTLADKYVND